MSHAIVYTATDTRNGRVYVGQTWLRLDERKAAHFSWARGHRPATLSPLHRALLKAGSYFVWEIVAHAWTQAELDALECAWIEKLQSMIDQRGYNMRSGGREGYKATEAVGQRISASKTGKPRSEAHRAQQAVISKAMPGRFRKLSPRAIRTIKTAPAHITQATLARHFGVRQSHISILRRGLENQPRCCMSAAMRAKVDFPYILTNPDNLTHKLLAEKFGVTTTVISWIRNKHVTQN